MFILCTPALDVLRNHFFVVWTAVQNTADFIYIVFIWANIQEKSVINFTTVKTGNSEFCVTWHCFEGYVAIGIISLFAIQVSINLGVVVGVFPVTGVTLPLFSYGGSSLVIVMSMLGIVNGIK